MMPLVQFYALWGAEQTEGVDEALKAAGLPGLDSDQPVSSVLPADSDLAKRTLAAVAAARGRGKG